MSARNRARAVVRTCSRIARETSANERYCVVEPAANGRMKVRQAHWAPGKSITIPWGNRGRLSQGQWVLGSKSDGTVEVSQHSAYQSGTA